MNLELLRVAIAILGTAWAAKQDHDTSYIDDRLTMGMIALGGILTFLSLDTPFILATFIVAVVVFAFGYALYRAGQIGGGDVLLFAALALLIPEYPSFAIGKSMLISFPPILAVILLSSFLAILGTAVWYSKLLNWRRLRPEFKLETGIMIVFAITILASAVFSKNNIAFAAFIAALLAAGVFLYAFRKQIMEEIVIKKVPLEDLEDEDLLSIEDFPKALVKKYNLGKIYSIHAKSNQKKTNIVLKPSIVEWISSAARNAFEGAGDVNFTHKETLEEIRKKYAIKRFAVYKNLPRLGPYILAALLFAIIAGDFLSFLF